MADMSCKMVSVGDGNTGKTCILLVYNDKKFVETHVPTIIEDYTVQKNVGGKKVALTLSDTAGQEEYARLRPIAYSNSNVFLVVFSITEPQSLANVKDKWLPEIKHFRPNVPFLLVGNKTDLRGDPLIMTDLKKRGLKPVTFQEGNAMARSIGAFKYLECSAKLNKGIQEIFEEALSSIVNTSTPKKKFCPLF